MIKKEESKFLYIFYRILIIISFLSAIFFIFLYFKLVPEFFLRYSSDGLLKQSTIEKIEFLRILILSLGVIFLTLSAIAYFFKNKTKEIIKKRENIIKNILLLIVVIIFLLFITELVLRSLLKNETSWYSSGPGNINFNQKYVSLNEDKMRDRNFAIEKPANTIRVAAIGDSFTFGAGVKNVNDTYPKVLEKELNSLNRSKKYEVLNFGIPGTDTEAQVELIKSKALKYKPDVIIIGYFINDFKNVDINKPNPEKRLEIPYLGFWLRDLSYFYYFLESRVNNLVKNCGMMGRYEQGMLDIFNSSVNKDYNEQLLKNLSSIARKEKIRIIVVIFPAIYHLDNYSFTEIHNFITNKSTENGFYVVDLLDDYKNYSSDQLVVNKYDSHPNELGHKIAADSILEIFINKRL